MNKMQSHTAFASLSSFTPHTHRCGYPSFQHTSTLPQPNIPTMVAPKHVRRSEEIKRLTKQLEQLRAARDKIKKQPSSPPSSSSPTHPPSQEPAPPTSLTIGKHAEGSRFLSVTDFAFDQYFPRILPVAGTVPGLDVAQLQATPRLIYSKQPDLGNVFVTTLPKDYQGELIAMPLSESISEYNDPVILKVDPSEFSSAQLPCADNDYVYVILDRGTADSDFDNTKFYAWDVDGIVKVGWVKDKPAEGQVRCLGRVLMGTLEIRKDLRQKRSCWEEENDAYA